MPDYKRQHYLPAAYLRNFSIDQSKCTRDAWVWRFDGDIHHPVPVVSQCASDYHYSRLNPAKTEAGFKVTEDRYCRCIDRIKAGKKLTNSEYGDLLVTMFDFQLRNAVHKNNTNKEGIDAYRTRNGFFMREVLLGRKTGDVTPEEVINHISRYWGVRVVCNRPGHVFITSDNPSVWISINDHLPGLHMVTLPITPTLTAIAFDKRILEVVSDQINAEDELTLNAGQIENSVQCVYSSGQMPMEQLEILQNHFDRKGPTGCVVNEGTWNLRIQGIPPKHYFSFTRLSPPLL